MVAVNAAMSTGADSGGGGGVLHPIANKAMPVKANGIMFQFFFMVVVGLWWIW